METNNNEGLTVNNLENMQSELIAQQDGDSLSHDLDLHPGELDEDNETGSGSVMKDYSEFTKEQLLEEMKTLCGNATENVHKDIENIKNVFYRLFRLEKEAFDKEQLESDSEVIEEYSDKLEEEFRNLYNKYKQQRQAYAKQQEEQKEANLLLKKAVIEELKELVNEEESLNQTFQKFHAIQNKWKSIGPVPQSAIKDLWETYQHCVEKFYDYVKINKELRDLDLKRNLEIKLSLIERAKSLVENPSIHEAFASLQELHESWREVGPVPREQKDEIWDQFKEITLNINKRNQAFFEQRKVEQQRNLELKKILCERVEKLTESFPDSVKTWQKMSDELMSILEEWKGIGFVPKKENTEIYTRFKLSRDKFFQARREFYKKIKQEAGQNLKIKRELCEQAEALANSEDWKATSDILIRLQKDWKKVGMIPRKASDEIWKRFRTACDTFFNRKSEFFAEKDSQYVGNLEAKLELIKEIESFEFDEDREVNFQALKEFQNRWREIGFVPLKEKDKVQKSYQKAIDEKYAILKVSDNERKVMKYRDRIENINHSGRGDRVLRSERDKLINKIHQLEADISLWENNIGFFAKSKNADKMIAEVESNVKKAKEEIVLLEEKIGLIDQQE